MKEDITEIIAKELKKRCDSPNNFWGPGAFYHVKAVVDNARFLSKKYDADEEIVTLAAWLHDIGSITNKEFYEEHHLHGARIAEELLLELSYPKERLELIKNCILNHRGSVLKQKNTIEEICIADADSISHFYSVPSLFYLAYVIRGYTIEEGMVFVKNKLERSYQKLSEEGKKVYQEKYKQIMSVFE